MRTTHGFLVVALALSAACSRGLELPGGDADRGRQVFMDLQCHTCHRVLGETLPDPVADPAVPVVLGNPADRKTRAYLAESIIAPSHQFARPRPDVIYSEPPIVRQREYEDIREGELSRMGDFGEVMTVRHLIDLVAYLESMQERSPGEIRPTRGQ